MNAILSALILAVLVAVIGARAQGPTVMPLHEKPHLLPELVFAEESGERRSA